MALIVAGVIRYLHMAVLAVALLGWLAPSQELLKAYAVFMILTMLQWSVCNNRCILTIWEHKLTGVDSGPGAESFIGRILTKLTGRKPSSRFVDGLSYSIGTICLLLALLRLYGMVS